KQHERGHRDRAVNGNRKSARAPEARQQKNDKPHHQRERNQNRRCRTERGNAVFNAARRSLQGIDQNRKSGRARHAMQCADRPGRQFRGAQMQERKGAPEHHGCRKYPERERQHERERYVFFFLDGLRAIHSGGSLAGKDSSEASSTASHLRGFFFNFFTFSVFGSATRLFAGFFAFLAAIAIPVYSITIRGAARAGARTDFATFSATAMKARASALVGL